MGFCELQIPQLPLQLLLLLLCCCGCLVSSSTGDAADCALFTRRSDGVTWLDCRHNAAACCYDKTKYVKSRRLFVGIRRSDSLAHWELSPALLGNQTINRLPEEAFRSLDNHLNATTVLVLRRLHQANFSLAALAALPRLRHLSLHETNATCLPAGAFARVGSGHLLSLDLIDNRGLNCLQPGVFAGLGQLRRLQIDGSPRLLRIDPSAFCGLSNLVSLSLRLPTGAAAPWAALSGLPDTLSELMLARGRQPPDDSAALELLPDSAGFICARPSGLEFNGLPVGRLLADRLHLSVPEFCADILPDHHTDVCPTRPPSSGTVSPTVPASTAASQRAAPQAASPDRRPNFAGTVLLTSSAFAAGVVATLYCFVYLRRVGRLKPSSRSSATLLPPVASVASVTSLGMRDHRVSAGGIANDGPVRLIGFTSLSDGSCGGAQRLTEPSVSESDGRLFIVHGF